MASQDLALLDFVVGLGADIPQPSTCNTLITHHAIRRVTMHRLLRDGNIVPEDKTHSVDMLRCLVELGADFNEA